MFVQRGYGLLSRPSGLWFPVPGLGDHGACSGVLRCAYMDLPQHATDGLTVGDTHTSCGIFTFHCPGSQRVVLLAVL